MPSKMRIGILEEGSVQEFCRAAMGCLEKKGVKN